MAGIVLVRHAHTAWSGRRYCGRSDPPLSAAGRRAAAILASELAGLSLPDPRIVSSAAVRARQTAAVIADAIGQPLVDADPYWGEVDFGIAEGRTFDELAILAPQIAEQILDGAVALDWPDGETAVAFEARVLAAWAAVAAIERATIVVTHGGPIRLILARATGREASAIEVPAPASVVQLPRDVLGHASGAVIPSRA